jgi:hypothetical protein
MRNSTSEREPRSIDGYLAAVIGVLLIAGTVLSFVLAPGHAADRQRRQLAFMS